MCLRCAGARVLQADASAATSSGSVLPALTIALDPAAADLPERIGQFEIIEEVGRGGMGRVFAARQIGLGRIVALKAIPAGRNTADLELRFLREAQTAARLRHPHIVTVHDSGRAHGFVYFAMDYIEGGDLARRLRERPFAPREAAELLHPIAMALAYTHAEGVLHRDLKPSNILLDGGAPRIADFGLAAQLEVGGDLTAMSGVLGTPHYLAPEALRHGSGALTVASDLYALGVMLFELLTGRTPFAGASPAELPTLVEQSDPPSPRVLAPAVPGDLEIVCLKCLERDPARRYAGAAALAEDLRRFLADEPILARRPGGWDRFAKFSRRHRAAVVAAVVVIAVLLIATAVSVTLAVQARRAERLAATEARTSKELAEFLQNDLLAQASPEQQPDRDLKMRTVVDRAGKRIEGRFAEQPLVEAALRVTLAATYEGLGEYAAELPHLERALALRRRQLGPDVPDTLRVIADLTMVFYHLARYKEAEASGTEVWTRQKSVLGAEHPDTLASASTLALVLQSAGKLPESEALYRPTLAARRRVLGPDHDDTLTTASGLGTVLRARGQLAEAEELLRGVLAVRRRISGNDHPATMRAINEVGAVLVTVGRLAEAETLFTESLALARRVIGPEAPDTLTTLSNLAVTYQSQSKYAEAQPILDEAVALQRRIRGPDHPNTLNTMIGRALNLTQLEDFAAAETAYAEITPLLQRVLGPDHTFTIGAMINRAVNYDGAGQFEAAAQLIDDATAAAKRVFGPEHSVTFSAVNSAGVIARDRGRLDDAVTLHTQAWEGRRRVLGAEHPSTLVSLHNLAADEQAQGKLESALARHRQILEIRLRKAGAANFATLLSQEAVATLLLRQGDFTGAEALLRPVWENRKNTGAEHWRTFAVASQLGEALAGQRRFVEAEPLLLQGFEELQHRAGRIPPAYRVMLVEAGRRLPALYVAWGRPVDAEKWTARLAGVSGK